MRKSDVSLPRLMLLGCCLFLIPLAAWPQTVSPQSRIVSRVDENALITLRGNTHPLAQPQFDQGAAPPDLPMARMLLVLKRSEAQEAALEKLLDDQQDLNSPSYHQWFTPDAFGQQFGPSDQDIQTIAAWLLSHGFQIGSIGRGRTVIEFSGTASQVQQAFHTEIHKYRVNGEDHWANASDPQIPSALAPVVVGIASLHNYRHRPMHFIVETASKSGIVERMKALGPQFTTVDSNLCPGQGNCYFLGPYDFATIYNVLPLWTASPAIDGTGQSIAIADESNINLQDVRDFRNLFGLPANDPQIFLDGPDPGLVPDGAETEALIDVEWAGAVAKGATIKLVVSPPTNPTQGADLAALYAIENNLAPVLSESFGTCELFLGTAGNAFQDAIREQAAAQGITFITSAGDSGAAGCDGFSGGNTTDPATFGLAVNGLASSPHGVALGGTDFMNFGPSLGINSPSPYWSPNNNSLSQSSALGYVPETTWNDSCANNIFVLLQWGSTPEASCNNSQLPPVFVSPVGGGGGKSSCTSSNGTATSTCAGGYTKPAWQAAPGVPKDGMRDIPDVSLFASGGFMASAYIICEADQPFLHGSCSLNSPNDTFLPVGGTSVSAPAFAGILALVNQSTGSTGQGNANYVLYKLASSSAQTSQLCGATSGPASGCIFNDITSGTIAEPCAKSSPNCNFSNASDTYGILTGYNAGAGYDLATGLGSVNAYNLVHNWIQPSLSSTTTLSLNSGKAVSITHGQSIAFDITVAPSAATGFVALEGAPAGSGSVSMASFPLQNGAASGTTATLGGGNSYSVKAHYSGDGTYKPSDSNAVTVTVAPEASNTLISIPVFNPTTGAETGNTPTSLVYGSVFIERVDVGNAKATLSFPPQQVCANLTCPTGTVTVTDSVNGGTATPLGPGTFALNSAGFAEYQATQLNGGQHALSASYGGDNSYLASTGTYNLMVTPAPTQMPAPYTPSVFPFVIAQFAYMHATVSATSPFFGAAPTGTVTFYDGTTPIAGPISYTGIAGYSTFPGYAANLTATITVTNSFASSGFHQISAQYSGDANYAAATSPAISIPVVYVTTAVETASSQSVNWGSSVNVTASITGAAKSPQMTGSLQFSNGFQSLGTVTPAAGTDANGNQILTGSLNITPPNSEDVQVNYSGDSNYEFANADVYINVNLPNFSMATAPSTLNVSAGQSVSTQLTVTPLTNISSSVALTCNVNSLAGATCTFNPASPVGLANSTPTAAMLTISTLPPSSNLSTSTVAIRPAGRWRMQPPTPALWMLGLANALAGLAVLLWDSGRRYRPTSRLAFLGLLCIVLGCGSSGSSGGVGGGGGNSGPTPTTLTLTTTSIKIPQGAGATFTATVTTQEGKVATGTVSLLDSGTPIASSYPVNGVAAFVPNYMAVGTHVLTAHYQGDSNNQPSSTTGSINQVITGNGAVGVTGMSAGLVNSTAISVAVQ